MTECNKITNAEWTVMRIIWTLQKCTSRQIIQVMNRKNSWTASTVKTLITRLRKKRFINSQKQRGKNLYTPRVSEQKAADWAVQNVFQNICPMHAGRALNYLLKNITISQNDVQQLIKTLNRLQKTAPSKVNCNCLDPDAQKEVQHHANK